MSEKGILRSFPRTFWVANVMELFERAAYYGLNSVLAIYLTARTGAGGLGFAEESVGFLQSIVYALTYVIPILGGALAEKFGYRRMLIAAFCLLGTGYIVAGHMTVYPLVFTALAVMAFGAGLFKPIISGTIARTTSEKNSGFGFGIYYWMINLGAFLGPLVVSYLKGFSWRYVFLASALYTGLMLLPNAFLFRDPPRPASTKKLKDVLLGAAEVLGDARFMLMIVVYSGFWVLYFQQFGSMLWYLRDFIDKAPVNAAVNGLLAALHIPATFSFDAEHVTVINAGTIILLQVLVSRIVKERPAVPVMATGMAFGVVGFVLLATSWNPWVFIAGIVVFTLGEMTAHPKYYSFIGIIAPADRKAVYLGYAFLYGVFGSLLGSNLGGLMYTTILKPVVQSPDPSAAIRLFWLLFAALDVVACVGLVLFYRSFGQDTPETRARARRVMVGVYAAIALLGVAFLAVGIHASPVQWKTVVQSVIFIALGGCGIAISLARRGSTA